MAKLSATAVVVLVLFAFLAGQSVAGRYYQDKVEDKVRKEVEKAIKDNRGIGAALVRLVFHDCWVNGCDGSVLLEQSADGASPEKNAKNNIGLAGFDVIDRIKDKVRNDNVSCADIVVLAGRDAVAILSGEKITYSITRGRLDGVRSSKDDADAVLPTSDFDFGKLKSNFDAGFRKFTVEELVVLSGAHSIGVAHLSSYAKRLSTADTPDFQIDSSYRAALNNATPPALLDQKKDPIVPNNVRDETDAFQKQANYDPAALGVSKEKQVLDNSYYHNTLENKVLFKSDWVLRTDGEAAGKLEEYKEKPEEWNKDFAAAMAKLSSLPAQGSNLEVRRNCRVPNSYRQY
ncbi:hypothetical protein EJB05_21553, partial [Eragrostis curvula]